MSVNFFIKRPIFSTVIAIVIVLAGGICIPLLPVAQFPQIAPPTVQVTGTYTGASAEVVEQSVTEPIEEQVNGVEGMTYMQSQSSNDGTSKITVTFDVGYDLDIAAVDVQNRVSMALPQVPEDVRRYGVITKKQSTNMTLAINLISPNKTYNDLYLSNYAAINIVDVLKRIQGVGDVQVLGERKYSMRLWLDPNKLTSMNLTANDVVTAVRNQNIQVAAGSIGQPPVPQGQAFQYMIQTKGRLEEIEEFEDIIVRTREDGAIVRVRDVGSVELGAESYSWFSELNGVSSATIGVYQLPDANSVDIAKGTYAALDRLSARFPGDLEYRIVYDTTTFVRASIDELVETLFIAILLVFLVIFVFLGDWRSTLIPAITIPVSLIGTFGLMMAFGFSINTLSLFGLVLAIGLVVDDSIVVVENITRLIEEENMNPVKAAMQGMAEVIGPVIATTLVLFAVFIPVAFIPGISGQLYQQFALTIAFSVGISSINAMTLSPALCSLVLRKRTGKKGWFFTKFDYYMDKLRDRYKQYVDVFIKRWKFIGIVFLILMAATVYLFRVVPTGFVPDEDQGYFIVMIQGPEGASLQRTEAVSKDVENILSVIPGVEDVLMIGGYNLIMGTLDSSSASAFVILKPWDKRTAESESLEAILETAQMEFWYISDALVFGFNPPPIQGLGTTGGFQFMLQDYEGKQLDDINDVALRLMKAAGSRKELGPLSTTFKVNYPQYYIDLDRTKAQVVGVEVSDVFAVLQAYLGSYYVNDFNKFGRVYRVFIQAKDQNRTDVTDIARLYVRNKDGAMIPLSALATIREIRGPQTITHYNLYRTIEIDGANAPGYSSGQAIQTMEQLAATELPDGFGYEWTGVAYQEIKSGGMAGPIFILAILFVYLFLAAQYESWAMPVMVMFAVPLAILGALGAQSLRGLANDVYCQIGLVMLIGLASKNAILIVEFAKQKREEGHSIVESAVLAAKLRLRPILMTALSFIFGILPLVFASGAGAASRHSLGTAVCGGMIASTFLSLIVVPVFYVVIQNIREKGFIALIRKPK